MQPVQSPLEKNFQYALECWRLSDERSKRADECGCVENLKKAAIAFKGLAEQIETHVKQLELELLYTSDPDEPWYNK